MRGRSLAVYGAIAAALSVGVAACGSDDEGSSGSSGGESGGGALTIYSSMPLQGDSRPQSEDVVHGEEMALAKAGGKVGSFTVKLKSLDDATPATGKWDAGKVSENARAAISDDSAVAYIGEFNSGASAISIPLTNEASLLQVSPSNTAAGLTRSQGAAEGEPDKYYPSGKRTFGRVVPADHIQAAAQASYMKELGVTKLYILNDKEVYGKGVADQVASAAEALGIKVLGNEGIDTKAANYRSVAGTIKSSGADGFFYGGITANKGVQVMKDVNAAVPDAKLFGPDGVAEEAFASKIGGTVEKQIRVTAPTLDPKDYPPAAQEFFTEFKDKYGKDPNPYAIYGFEAMNAVLEGIKNAGGKATDREAVVDGFFKVKNRESVLGTYSIDENGDTTLADYGGYKIEGGKLVFDQVIKAATPS